MLFPDMLPQLVGEGTDESVSALDKLRLLSSTFDWSLSRL